MKTLTATRFTDGLIYGEGPRWHDDRLWFTDGPANAVKAVDADGRIEVVFETRHPSGLGWLPDGTMVITALRSAVVTLVDTDGAVVTHDLNDRAWSTNDLVAGPNGAIYVDLYHRDRGGAYNENGGGVRGEIALVTPQGQVQIVASDVTLPNGLAVSADGSTLVASDTGADRIVAYDIADDGKLENARTFAELAGSGHPDGLCLDAEGAAWVGCYDAEAFVRVLEGGQITHRVPTGGGWAVAPALGGPDRRTLYLVINDTTIEGLAANHSKGRIETVHVDVPGAGWP